jgi:hypothetical protein
MMTDEQVGARLRAIGVVRDDTIYHFRLFSPREREIILTSLPESGAAGMMDELEMVQYDVHGREMKPLP